MSSPAAPRRVTIETNWRAHSDAQRSILSTLERVVDVTCGRRFGKSALGRHWLTGLHEDAIDGALLIPETRNWYAAPTRSPSCTDFYKKLKLPLMKAGLVKDKSDTYLRLTLFNDSVIECVSLDEPDNLLGPGLDRLLIDEKGKVGSEAWYQVLAPMLADPPERCLRRVMRIGTPRGKKHWTYGEHMASLEAKKGPRGRSAWQFPTWVRPGGPPGSQAAKDFLEFIEEMRRSMPELLFRQEFGAEFLDDGSGYFMHVGYDGKPPGEPEAGAVYAAGIDLAHDADWTVVLVLRVKPEPMRVVAIERFSRAPWTLTKSRIVAVLRRWNADAMLDATPGGAPSEVIVEALRPEWTRVVGFDARSQEGSGREDALAYLAIQLEGEEKDGVRKEKLLLPGTREKPGLGAPGFAILAAELAGFSYKILSSGRARAEKGHGLCDDTVQALAMAAWKSKSMGGGGYASRKTY